MLGLFPQYEDFYKLFRKRPGKVWEICANFNYCNDKLFFKKTFSLFSGKVAEDFKPIFPNQS